MKKLVSLIVCVVLITGCDKIKKPDQRPPQVSGCITDTLVNTLIGTSSRKVLIEDYTGHKCPNCPRAGATAEKLLTDNPGRVVVIANHVTTTYADASKDSTNRYKENFHNDASDIWDSKDKGFSISNAGLPQGMINRGGNPNFAQQDGKWASLVATALSQAMVARLDIKTYYDITKQYLTVNVKTSFVTTYTNNINVVIVLTQDGMVGCQKDQNPSNAPDDRDKDDPQTRLHYEFDHVVIDAMNSAQGQLVKAAPIAKNDTASIFSSCYLLKKCFVNAILPTVIYPPYIPYCIDYKKVNVVAFIYDTSTMEVLQVETLPILK